MHALSFHSQFSFPSSQITDSWARNQDRRQVLLPHFCFLIKTLCENLVMKRPIFLERFFTLYHFLGEMISIFNKNIWNFFFEEKKSPCYINWITNWSNIFELLFLFSCWTKLSNLLAHETWLKHSLCHILISFFFYFCGLLFLCKNLFINSKAAFKKIDFHKILSYKTKSKC